MFAKCASLGDNSSLAVRPVLPGDSKCSTLEAMGLERKNPGLESGHEITGDPLAAPVRHVIQFDALYHAALAVVDFQDARFRAQDPTQTGSELHAFVLARSQAAKKETCNSVLPLVAHRCGRLLDHAR